MPLFFVQCCTVSLSYFERSYMSNFIVLEGHVLDYNPMFLAVYASYVCLSTLALGKPVWNMPLETWTWILNDRINFFCRAFAKFAGLPSIPTLDVSFTSLIYYTSFLVLPQRRAPRQLDLVWDIGMALSYDQIEKEKEEIYIPGIFSMYFPDMIYSHT